MRAFVVVGNFLAETGPCGANHSALYYNILAFFPDPDDLAAG